MNYSELYKKIKKSIVASIKEAILEKHFYKMDFKEKKAWMKEWLKFASEKYGIKSPKLVISKSRVGEKNGCYEPLLNRIILSRCSIVTLLHEFKHALDFQKQKHVNLNRSFLEAIGKIKRSEDKARGWSVSLFAQASPKHYQRAVEKEKLLFK